MRTASSSRRAAAKGSAGLTLAEALGHTIVPTVPSLFTFHVDDPRLKGLEGVAAPTAVASVPGMRLRETGPVLVTHWGLSGPAILRLSAWGARELHGVGYHFSLTVNWAGARTIEEVRSGLEAERLAHPRRQGCDRQPLRDPGAPLGAPGRRGGDRGRRDLVGRLQRLPEGARPPGRRRRNSRSRARA